MVVLIFVIMFHLISTEASNYSFPENFYFGVATASFQIEGAWNQDGKSESIWDYSSHNNPDLVADKSNADISSDFYHKWSEDIKLMKKLGLNFYRFSISWSRILPLGAKNSKVNNKGVAFYNNLINGLLAEGIKPFVTIYHWDLPQILQDKGGWLNETTIEDYIYYATLLFELYGDRVKYWSTFNEISYFCKSGYGNGIIAPFLQLPGVGGYKCGHNTLLAHGRTYRLYEKKFKPAQRGKVGLVELNFWCDPKTGSESDEKAAERFMEFNFGLYVHPILIGNYPPIVIQRVDELSKTQGYATSRLPKFTSKEVGMIKGSVDFLGVNHYSSYLCTFDDNFPQPSFQADSGVRDSINPKWKASASPMVQYAPSGLRKALIWIKEKYNNPPVMITENGWSSNSATLDDVDHIQYFQGYLSELLKAFYEHNCNVFGYALWTLMDCFEWNNGYTQKYGLAKVDFNSLNRTRTPRKSFEEYQKIIRNRKL